MQLITSARGSSHDTRRRSWCRVDLRVAWSFATCALPPIQFIRALCGRWSCCRLAPLRWRSRCDAGRDAIGSARLGSRSLIRSLQLNRLGSNAIERARASRRIHQLRRQPTRTAQSRRCTTEARRAHRSTPRHSNAAQLANGMHYSRVYPECRVTQVRAKISNNGRVTARRRETARLSTMMLLLDGGCLIRISMRVLFQRIRHCRLLSQTTR
jgi:hypothetical protein